MSESLDSNSDPTTSILEESMKGKSVAKQCPHCDYKVFSKVAYRYHLASHEQPQIIECPFCDYTIPYSKRYRFRDHLFVHVEEDLKCPQCPYKTRAFVTFKQHVDTHGPPSTCNVCSYTTRYQYYMKEHQLTHLNKEVKDKSLKANKCAICNHSVSSPANYRNHVAACHPDGELMSCSHCNYETEKCKNMKRHLARRHFVFMP